MTCSGVETEAYREHKIARQIGAASISAGLSLVHAAGDYRINKAVFQTNPHDSWFQNGSRSLYEDHSPVGRGASRLFFLKRGEPVATHQAGLRLRSAASWGSFVPLAGRFAANLYVTRDQPIPEDKDPAFLQKVAIDLDSAAMATQTTSVLLFCSGQQTASHTALKLHWKSGFIGSGLQMAAGMLRLEQEMEHYFETGEINNSTVFYSAADSFGGAAGIAWSHEVLKEAGRVRTPATATAVRTMNAEHRALLGMVEPAARVKIGLRLAGSVGSVISLGFNLYDLSDAVTDDAISKGARNKRILSDGIGITGSLLMITAGLLIGTTLAPAAGLALAAGTLAFIGQTAFDYWA